MLHFEVFKAILLRQSDYCRLEMVQELPNHFKRRSWYISGTQDLMTTADFVEFELTSRAQVAKWWASAHDATAVLPGTSKITSNYFQADPSMGIAAKSSESTSPRLWIIISYHSNIFQHIQASSVSFNNWIRESAEDLSKPLKESVRTKCCRKSIFIMPSEDSRAAGARSLTNRNKRKDTQVRVAR